MELLLKAKLPVSVLEGLHNELVQVVVSPVPESKTAEWVIINPENLVASIVTINSQSWSCNHAWINEDSLPVDNADILVEAISNTHDSFFNVDRFSGTAVSDVGFEVSLALSTAFPLLKFDSIEQ